MKCLKRHSLQLLFEICFRSDESLAVQTGDMHGNGCRTSLQYPLFLSYFNQK